MMTPNATCVGRERRLLERAAMSGEPAFLERLGGVVADDQVGAGSAHGLWENVTVAWTVGMGVDGSGRGHVFRQVAANDNGQMGWGAQCTECLFEDTEAVGDNWRGFDPFWEAGGGKWVATRKTTIRRHYAAGNGGPGIWLDGGNTGNVIEGCRVVDNEVAGIMLELDTVDA